MTAKAILIVDDDELRCELLAELLEDEGYDVRIANDGEAGLADISSKRADLVLLDIIMPRIDGVRFLQALTQKVDSPPPVIVISGSVDSIGGKTLEEMGVARTVRKPVDPVDLIDQIASVLGESPGTDG
ncbi:MAG: response regulator [Erythrobacter sp.]|nr:response regulator [Erythrobacter sp.]